LSYECIKSLAGCERIGLSSIDLEAIILPLNEQPALICSHRDSNSDLHIENVLASPLADESMAVMTGFEPVTHRLTADSSTTELHDNGAGDEHRTRNLVLGKHVL
jgi:hypothetical protein